MAMKAFKGPRAECPVCNKSISTPLEPGSLIDCPECGEYTIPLKTPCDFAFSDLTARQRAYISRCISDKTAEDPGIIILESEFRGMLAKAV